MNANDTIKKINKYYVIGSTKISITIDKIERKAQEND